jgi:hypothetical protein
MTATRTEREVAIWLTDLGKLTAGHAPLADAKAKIATLSAALAAEFDASTFNRASLLHVARRCKFFPTFGEACEALAEWRKEHPRHVAIAAPISDPNEDLRRKHREEHEVAEASWHGITDTQIRAKIRALDGHPMRLMLGHMLATAIRRHAPQHLGLLPPEFIEMAKAVDNAA